MRPQPLRPTLLDVPISFFKYDHERKTFANVPAERTVLRRMVNTAYYSTTIEAIRAETDPVKQATLKKRLPAISPVALLYHRRRDTSFAEKISQQWPLLMGDLDQKDNPGVDMAELKKHMARLPYVLLCAYSVRGGLWFVVRLPDHQTPESLAGHFRYIQKLFSEKFGVELDGSKGGNPTHLRFVSYDPAPYLNESPTVLAGTYTPATASIPPRVITLYQGTSSENAILNYCVQMVEEAHDGEKHTKLNKAAFTAGGFIASGVLDETTAILALENAISRKPNVADFQAAQHTIRKGIQDGKGRPLTANEQPPQANRIEVNSVPARPRLHDEVLNAQAPKFDVVRPPQVEPTTKKTSSHEWQQTHPAFSSMGLPSLKHP